MVAQGETGLDDEILKESCPRLGYKLRASFQNNLVRNFVEREGFLMKILAEKAVERGKNSVFLVKKSTTMIKSCSLQWVIEVMNSTLSEDQGPDGC